jgi:hypothetical protein
MFPGQAASACPPLPRVTGSPVSAYSERIGPPHRLRPPLQVASLRLAPQDPSGPPTLLMDPDRPSGRSPTRVLCGGFWRVHTIAVGICRAHGAVSSFRECGLPYGRRGALCTLHRCRSAFTSFTDAWSCTCRRRRIRRLVNSGEHTPRASPMEGGVPWSPRSCVISGGCAP